MTTHALFTIRELGPDEPDVLLAVFAGLSPRSRHMRYLGAVNALTSSTVARLSAIDGSTHIAVVAMEGTQPIGIARLVAVDTCTADLAVEVVDAAQGRGVGRRLVRAVAAAGGRAGFTHIVADAYADNRSVLALLRSTFPALSVSAPDGNVVSISAALHDQNAAAA